MIKYAVVMIRTDEAQVPQPTVVFDAPTKVATDALAAKLNLNVQDLKGEGDPIVLDFEFVSVAVEGTVVPGDLLAGAGELYIPVP